MASIDLVWGFLVWHIFQAMTTSDLPLLGEKKQGWQELWSTIFFGLVWFGISSKQ
jgi:hypothetical protein